MDGEAAPPAWPGTAFSIRHDAPARTFISSQLLPTAVRNILEAVRGSQYLLAPGPVSSVESQLPLQGGRVPGTPSDVGTLSLFWGQASCLGRCSCGCVPSSHPCKLVWADGGHSLHVKFLSKQFLEVSEILTLDLKCAQWVALEDCLQIFAIASVLGNRPQAVTDGFCSGYAGPLVRGAGVSVVALLGCPVSVPWL